ncbi:BAH [Musa troglodytarum]|uniref:BAH n=1 Tax=Musa troglodytarum TaxID=320322 RepID=A0A9E7I9J4_9LILI|nr:BAH [Musa troglodytarum]
MGMTIEQAKKLDHFLCSDCDSENDAERSMNGFPASPSSEPKVMIILHICPYFLIDICLVY